VRAHADQPAAAREQAGRATLVPDQVEIIPDERVEVLDAKADEPPFGEAPGGRIDVMAVITKALTSAGLMKPMR
jgi:hypothetical protein